MPKSVDPWISEWGNPSSREAGHQRKLGRTRGSETSQYPEEKKSTEIPKVEAIEMGEARLSVAVILEEIPGKVYHRG